MALTDAAMEARWRLGARSETGYVRSSNEDRMGWTRTSWGNAYVVSDGMGGHLGGALAAEITVRTLRERLAAIVAGPPAPSASDGAGGDATRRPPGAFEEAVREAFAAANAAVRQRRDGDDPRTREMGATAVALVTAGARVLVGHVGDSRAYLWEPRAGLRRLTRDHTRTQTRLDAGLITAEEAADDPEASVLDRAIGHRPEVRADLSAWAMLAPGDMVLLCTDGLCGCVSEDEIDAVLRAGEDPQALADRLVEDALRKGGEDNVTVQLVMRCDAAPGGGAGGFGPPGWLGWSVAGVGAVMLVSVATAALVSARLMAPLDERLAALGARVDAIGQAQQAQQAQQARIAAASVSAPAMAPVAAPVAPSPSPATSTAAVPVLPAPGPTRAARPAGVAPPAAAARASSRASASTRPVRARPPPAASPASDAEVP